MKSCTLGVRLGLLICLLVQSSAAEKAGCDLTAASRPRWARGFDFGKTTSLKHDETATTKTCRAGYDQNVKAINGATDIVCADGRLDYVTAKFNLACQPHLCLATHGEKTLDVFTGQRWEDVLECPGGEVFDPLLNTEQTCVVTNNQRKLLVPQGVCKHKLDVSYEFENLNPDSSPTLHHEDLKAQIKNMIVTCWKSGGAGDMCDGLMSDAKAKGALETLLRVGAPEGDISGESITVIVKACEKYSAEGCAVCKQKGCGWCTDSNTCVFDKWGACPEIQTHVTSNAQLLTDGGAETCPAKAETAENSSDDSAKAASGVREMDVYVGGKFASKCAPKRDLDGKRNAAAVKCREKTTEKSCPEPIKGEDMGEEEVLCEWVNVHEQIAAIIQSTGATYWFQSYYKLKKDPSEDVEVVLGCKYYTAWDKCRNAGMRANDQQGLGKANSSGPSRCVWTAKLAGKTSDEVFREPHPGGHVGDCVDANEYHDRWAADTTMRVWYGILLVSVSCICAFMSFRNTCGNFCETEATGSKFAATGSGKVSKQWQAGKNYKDIQKEQLKAGHDEENPNQPAFGDTRAYTFRKDRSSMRMDTLNLMDSNPEISGSDSQMSAERVPAHYGIQVEDKVLIHGLTRGEYNGKTGVVVDWLSKDGRILVEIDHMKGKQMALKPGNLNKIDDQDIFYPGDTVELKGLRSHRFNGLRGNIEEYVDAEDRYKVSLDMPDGSTDVKQLRPSNLERVKSLRASSAQQMRNLEIVTGDTSDEESSDKPLDDDDEYVPRNPPNRPHTYEPLRDRKPRDETHISGGPPELLQQMSIVPIKGGKDRHNIYHADYEAAKEESDEEPAPTDEPRTGGGYEGGDAPEDSEEESSDEGLQKGDIVTLVGLNKESQYNGREAEVIKFIPETARYNIVLGGKHIALRARNLKKTKQNSKKLGSLSSGPPQASGDRQRDADARRQHEDDHSPTVQDAPDDDDIYIVGHHPVPAGTKVVLKNLRHSEYNGMKGVVVDHVGKQQRYIVHLDKLGRSMAVKERNVYVRTRPDDAQSKTASGPENYSKSSMPREPGMPGSTPATTEKRALLSTDADDGNRAEHPRKDWGNVTQEAHKSFQNLHAALQESSDDENRQDPSRSTEEDEEIVAVDEKQFYRVKQIVESILGKEVRNDTTGNIKRQYDEAGKQEEDVVEAITEDLASDWGVEKFEKIQKSDKVLKDHVLLLLDDIVDGYSDESSGNQDIGQSEI